MKRLMGEGGFEPPEDYRDDSLSPATRPPAD